MLPDLSVDKWQYNGTDTLSFGRHKGLDAYRWVWTVKDDLGYGEYINTYTFYVSKVELCLAILHHNSRRSRHATAFEVFGLV